MKPLLPLLPLLAVGGSVHAINIVDSGATGSQVNLNGTYIQNFDTLASAPTRPGGYKFTNNITIPGWYSTQSLYAVNELDSGLGSWGDDADRALGSDATNWSVRFVNTSSQTITGFSVSFDVEQWYRGANSPQVTNTLQLYYRIYSADTSEALEEYYVGRAGWTRIAEAAFTSPNATMTAAEMLDGNLPENSGTVTFTIDGITLALLR